MIFMTKRQKEYEMRLDQMRRVLDELVYEERQTQIKAGTLKSELRSLYQDVRAMKTELSEMRMKVFAMRGSEDRQDHDIEVIKKQLANQANDGR